VERERETTQALQDKLAKMGYVQSQIRVSPSWIDPNDAAAPKLCRNKSDEPAEFRCVNLRIHVFKGPKVIWRINVKDRLAISRNAFLRFLATIFSADQFSRATIPPESDEIPLDHLIIEENLLDKITFISAKNVDEQELKESADEITEYLVNNGYANAEVIPSLIQEDEENILVNFDVYAGNAFFINSVSIMPDKFAAEFDEDALSGLVEVRSFGENGRLSYQQIEAAKDAIVTRLIARGYRKVKVVADIEALGNGIINVVFNVSSEEREVVDEIVILNGYADLNENIVSTLQNCDNYKPPSRRAKVRKLCYKSSLIREKIEDDARKLNDFYQSSGFLYAKVSSDVAVTESGIQLIFKIFDSRVGDKSLVPLVRQEIKDIIISGNVSTSANVIKRLFPKERRIDFLDPNALKRGLANLRDSGRFSRIDHKILAGEENSDDVYFSLQLTERPSLSLDTSIAFSTDQFFSLDAELEEANLFSSMLKLNSALRLGLFWGRQTMFSNKLIWPTIWGKPLRLTITAPTIIYDHLLHRPKPSRRLQSQISFALDWKLGPYVIPSVKYWLVLTQEELFDQKTMPHPSFSSALTSLDGLIPTIKRRGDIQGVLRPGISFINLDNLFDPRLGVDMNLWTELSGGPLLGKPPFVNLGSQNRFFIPIGPLTLALQATLMRAFIEPNEANWQKLRNVSSLNELGGDRSIRGYQDAAIGIFETKNPTFYSGYFSNTANVELRFPLTSNPKIGNISGAVFVDQGMLIPCSGLFKCLESQSLYSIAKNRGFGLSLGAALRYSLPVGPISLDYGISPITGDNRIHVLFGYAF
jgi:outer membrane protein assembly factor BamA